jgi:tetratricopeptide (TPR) repeat protein
LTRRLILAALLAALGGPAALDAQPRRVIDVRTPPPAADTFEARFAELRNAEQARDENKAGLALRELRRLRVERNVRQLEIVALPLVGRGLTRLRAAQRDGAEQDFRDAIALAPDLPDAWFGLARAQAADGLLGQLPALRSRAEGLLSYLRSWRGRDAAFLLAVPVLMMTLHALAAVLAVALLFRHGGLLRHDLEERLGGTPARALALTASAVLLLLPVLLFQGWGFLALWCLALLFAYMTAVERVLAGLALLATVATGPAAELVAERARTLQDPLRKAALLAVEAGPDEPALLALRQALDQSPDDRDLAYLLGRLYRKAGEDEQAAQVYRGLLEQHPDDAVALVNLANIEFYGKLYAAAITRYQQVAEGQAPAPVVATARYNLSLAYLQRFDRQNSEEARAHADRLAGALIAGYETRWRSDGAYAVVDVGPGVDDVRAKFGPDRDGVRANVFGREVSVFPAEALGRGLLTRFTGFALLLAALALGVRWRRGARMFTLRCLKCGTPFCRRCHLGKVVGGLCTQCYHLFVVRDGVSGSARNRKLLEVQQEEGRRERIFKLLSLVSPGAGHIYARRPLLGALLSLAWYGLVTLALLAGRMIPLTYAPDSLVGRTHLVLLGLLLVAVYVTALRHGPAFEAAHLARAPRRARGRA